MRISDPANRVLHDVHGGTRHCMAHCSGMHAPHGCHRTCGCLVYRAPRPDTMSTCVNCRVEASRCNDVHSRSLRRCYSSLVACSSAYPHAMSGSQRSSLIRSVAPHLRLGWHLGTAQLPLAAASHYSTKPPAAPWAVSSRASPRSSVPAWQEVRTSHKLDVRETQEAERAKRNQTRLNGGSVSPQPLGSSPSTTPVRSGNGNGTSSAVTMTEVKQAGTVLNINGKSSHALTAQNSPTEPGLEADTMMHAAPALPQLMGSTAASKHARHPEMSPPGAPSASGASHESRFSPSTSTSNPSTGTATNSSPPPAKPASASNGVVGHGAASNGAASNGAHQTSQSRPDTATASDAATVPPAQLPSGPAVKVQRARSTSPRPISGQKPGSAWTPVKLPAAAPAAAANGAGDAAESSEQGVAMAAAGVPRDPRERLTEFPTDVAIVTNGDAAERVRARHGFETCHS